MSAASKNKWITTGADRSITNQQNFRITPNTIFAMKLDRGELMLVSNLDAIATF
jgi:hypothetical protein